MHERAGDIPLLAISLLERVDRKSGRSFSAAALEWLGSRRFSGNIRELRNLIERATLLADGDTIERVHLTEMADDLPPLLSVAGDAFQLGEVVDLGTLERRYLDWARGRSGGSDLGLLAGSLGISQRTLYRKLKARR